MDANEGTPRNATRHADDMQAVCVIKNCQFGHFFVKFTQNVLMMLSKMFFLTQFQGEGLDNKMIAGDVLPLEGNQ